MQKKNLLGEGGCPRLASVVVENSSLILLWEVPKVGGITPETVIYCLTEFQIQLIETDSAGLPCLRRDSEMLQNKRAPDSCAGLLL